METLQDFYDVENQRKNTIDIENSIRNSLLDNQPTNRYICRDIVFDGCYWIGPFVFILFIVFIMMVIAVLVVKFLF